LVADVPAGEQLAQAVLDGGRAWEKFRILVEAQEGDVRFIDDPERLPKAALVKTVLAPRQGFLAGIHARVVGETSVMLGAGRVQKTDVIDHAVGVVVHHKVGDFVAAGEPLFTVHANDASCLQPATEALLSAHTWSDTPVAPLSPSLGIVTIESIQ
jgi:pyrimidine-nucleoside phosphorylase